MKMPGRSAVLLAGALMAGACSSTAPDCNLLGAFGISLNIIEGPSGTALQTASVTILLSGSDGYAETITSEGAQVPGPHGLLYERPGLYRVTVRADGYEEWQSPTVVVTRGECRVETVELTAALIHGA